MNTCKSFYSFKHKKEQSRDFMKIHWTPREKKKVAYMKMSTQSNRSNLKFSSFKYVFLNEIQKIIIKIPHC